MTTVGVGSVGPGNCQSLEHSYRGVQASRLSPLSQGFVVDPWPFIIWILSVTGLC
jgi:hypothetical protein